MEQNNEQKKKRWQYIFTRFMILALTILFFFFIYRFKDFCDRVHQILTILGPFIYGGIMAYMLRIPCNFFEKHLKKWLPERRQKAATGLSILISLFLVLMILYLLVRMVAPQLVISISSIVAALPDAIARGSQWIQTKLADDPEMANYIQTAMDVGSRKFQEWSQKDLLPLLQNMAGGFATTVTSVVRTFYNLGIGVVVCIYTLGARKQFARQAKAVLFSILKPKWAEYVLDEVRYSDKMFVGFFGGKILDSAIIGIVCYIVSLIFQFPNAMLISVIIGVTNIIPYFGPWIGAVPATLLILIVDPVKAIWFLIFIVFLQLFDGNILGPKLLGNSTGLSSFWVLFSITVFSGLFGFVGFLIGVPLFAVIYDLIRKLVVYGLKRNDRSDLLPEQEPVPVSPESEQITESESVLTEQEQTAESDSIPAEQKQIAESDSIPTEQEQIAESEQIIESDSEKSE